MLYLRFTGVLACVLVSGCVPPVAAQTVDNPQPSIAPATTAPATNALVSTALTCGELLPLIRAKSSGYATIWLDGYYAGRAGLAELPAGWIRTLSQGLGGTCTIDANAARPVLDVIAQLHREYDGVPHKP
jgi:hypothetical protein